MSERNIERLLDTLGGIEDCFLKEAETFDFSPIEDAWRMRMLKYGAVGIVVLGGAVAAYWKYRSNQTTKSA